jgi:hypothetical protein
LLDQLEGPRKGPPESSSRGRELAGAPLPGRPSDRTVAFFGAFVLLAVYLANGRALITGDAASSMYLAVNVVEHGRVGFTPALTPPLFESASIRGTLRASDRIDPATGKPLFVGIYGPGAGMAALPLFAALRPVIGGYLGHERVVWHVGKLAAALYCAAAAALLFLAARVWLEQAMAVVLAAAFGLGTSVWSSSSQSLWQHGPTTFFLMLGVLGVLRGGAWRLAGAGAALAAATACRPIAVVFLAATGLHLLARDRRGAVALAVGAAPLLAALVAFNTYWLGSPIRSGQLSIAANDVGWWSTPLAEGLAGILLSPSRGLFVFSPFLLLAFPGAWLAWRREEYAALRPLVVGVVVMLLIHAKWRYWWGGHSYGYRIIVDAAGPMVLMTVPVVGWATATVLRRGLLLGALGWSVLVHGLGAAVSGGTWNVAPNVDEPENKARLWSVAESAIPFEAARLYRFIRTGSPDGR